MNPFLQEISWFEFSRIPTINKLPLHEQERQYRLYMLDLHQAREQWMVQQHEGRSAAKEIQITGVTPTVTVTPSETPTATPTVTVTPTITVSNSVTPTVTPSETPTATPTMTVTVTPTITVSNSATPTVTPRLLQENLFDVLQEDGFQIYITFT